MPARHQRSTSAIKMTRNVSFKLNLLIHFTAQFFCKCIILEITRGKISLFQSTQVYRRLRPQYDCGSKTRISSILRGAPWFQATVIVVGNDDNRAMLN